MKRTEFNLEAVSTKYWHDFSSVFSIVSPELFYHLEVLGSDSWSCVGGAFVGVGSKGRNVGTIWRKIGARNDPMARWASKSEKYKFGYMCMKHYLRLIIDQKYKYFKKLKE